MIALVRNPWAWLVLVVGLTMSAGLGGRAGFLYADGKAVAKAATKEAERLTAVAEWETKVSALELNYARDIFNIGERHYREMQNAEAKKSALVAAVRDGSVRLSIPTAAVAGTDAPSSDPAAAGGSQETRSELMPAAAIALIDIAADGDDAVRDLNACIDSYDAIRLRPLE